MQHAIPALALLPHGVARVTSEAGALSLALGAAEILVSVVVIASFILALRAARAARRAAGTVAHHATHGSVDWVDIFIGVMLAVEVWAHFHETGHIRRPTLLLVPIMIGLGLAHGWIAARQQGRRMMRVSDAGVSIGRGRFLPRFEARWSELRAVEIGQHAASLVKKDGTVSKIDLADLTNASDVRAALEQARDLVPPPVPALEKAAGAIR